MQEVHFHYGWVQKLRVVVSFIFFLVLAYFDFRIIQEGALGTAVLVFGLSVVMLSGTGLFLICWSDVLINSEEIASTLFGRKWKSIRWEDITTITVTYPPDFQGGRDTMYWIGAASSKKTFASPKGRLVFTKDIRNLDALIRVINDHAKGRNIEFSEAVSGTLGGGLGKSAFKRIDSLDRLKAQVGRQQSPPTPTPRSDLHGG